MAETIVSFFRQLIGNDYVTIFIVSMIPFVEVRGSIPLAIAMGMNAFYAFALAFAGSVIVGPILLALLHPIMNWLKKFKLFKSLVEAVEDGFKGKANNVIEKAKQYDTSQITKRKMIGLYCFVGVPVPMTGVWTGSAIGTFLELSFWQNLLVITVGDLTACIIMTLLSYFCSQYIDIILYIIFAIVIIAIVIFIVKIVRRMLKTKKENTSNDQKIDN